MGHHLNFSTKLPVTNSNDAPAERPILNLRGYKYYSYIMEENRDSYLKTDDSKVINMNV